MPDLFLKARRQTQYGASSPGEAGFPEDCSAWQCRGEITKLASLGIDCVIQSVSLKGSRSHLSPLVPLDSSLGPPTAWWLMQMPAKVSRKAYFPAGLHPSQLLSAGRVASVGHSYSVLV